ncbi:MAG: nucleoside triphosphate pyrophosphohydrolase [Rickettsiaceae bacterium]|nr:nucleoside triphosphate pyrophosphohydrolase [Rickettsiaceae bacterium]
MKKYQFNKLIRSKLPAKMVTEGILVNSKILSDSEYIAELKRKLLEEADEVVNATTDKALAEELADVLEVIDAIIRTSKITREDIEQVKLDKRNINGDFSQENYINYIEVAEDNRPVIAYLENKNRHYRYEKD